MGTVLNIDESDFAVQTSVWLNGGVPYVDFVEKKPILIYLFYAASFIIGGLWNMKAVHIMFALIAAATGIFVMLAAQRIEDGKTGLAALALFAVYQAGYDLNDFLSANTEVLLNLFAAAAFLSASIALTGKNTRFFLFISGILIGLSALSKQVAVSILPAILIALLWRRHRQGNIMAGAADCILVLIGFIIPSAAATFFLKLYGALDDFIYWVWTANFTYAKSDLPFKILVYHAAERVLIYMAVSFPLWVLALARIVQNFKNRHFPVFDLLLILWFAFSFILMSVGFKFFPHYFIQLLPPLAVLAALGWNSWWRMLVQNRRALNTAAIILALVIPAVFFFILHIKEAEGLDKKYSVEKAIGSAIAENSGPDDRIFVWGYNSDIYYYARRLPAARFMYCSYLTGSIEGFEDFNRFNEPDPFIWNMLFEDLNKNRPAWIVDMSRSGIRNYSPYLISAYPRLYSFITANYEPVREISGAFLLKRRD
jgi:4-amino-4-deoxy-L-arabinose transferase-like glycosyltransferase